MQINIIKHNDVFLKIHAEKSVLNELSNYFSFRVPGYQFQPNYRNRLWDGYLRLFSNATHQIYIGLYDKIVEFCQKSHYTISEDSYKPTQNLVSKESIESYIKDTLQPASKGVKLDVREYQSSVVHHCITEGRATILSPTSSGKSLMLYSLIRYLLDNDMAKRVLFIFPSISLVNQLLSDFTDYSSINNWDAKSQSHMIFAGKEKITEHPLVFSTYQSLTKMPEKYFNSFDVIVVDECHNATAKSIKDIMEKSTSVPFKFGFTGTLADAKCHSLVLNGLFGSTYVATTTNELMQRDEVSKLSITCLILKYSKETCRIVSEASYPDEMKFLSLNKLRNNFIKNLAVSLKGNTLLLFQFIEQGKILLKLLKDVPNVHYVDGGTDLENREMVRTIAESSDNCIIVASYGTMSTGVNIRKLDNCIFCSSYKSKIKILQSLGRILRLAENKHGCKLYDISDNLCFKGSYNHTFRHFDDRIGYYEKEKFVYKKIEYQLEKD